MNFCRQAHRQRPAAAGLGSTGRGAARWHPSLLLGAGEMSGPTVPSYASSQPSSSARASTRGRRSRRAGKLLALRETYGGFSRSSDASAGRAWSLFNLLHCGDDRLRPRRPSVDLVANRNKVLLAARRSQYPAERRSGSSRGELLRATCCRRLRVAACNPKSWLRSVSGSAERSVVHSASATSKPARPIGRDHRRRCTSSAKRGPEQQRTLRARSPRTRSSREG